jgi:chromosome segregation ATPase
LVKLDTLSHNLKNKKVKSLKEQKEELEKEVKKHITKLNESKKIISRLEVDIEELKLTLNHQTISDR